MEIIIFGAVALISILIAILDLIGLLNITFFKDRIPVFTILVLGLLMSYMAFIHHPRQKKIESIMSSNNQLSTKQILDSISLKVDPKIKEVFSENVRNMENNLTELLEEKIVRVYNKIDNDLAYIDVMKHCENKHIIGVSKASNDYLWNENGDLSDLEMAVKIHCNKGIGKQTRIFLVDEKTRVSFRDSIFERQANLGVNVLWIEKDKVPLQNRSRYYMYCEDLSIGGSGKIDKEAGTRDTFFTTDLDKIKSFKANIEAILRLPLKKYSSLNQKD